MQQSHINVIWKKKKNEIIMYSTMCMLHAFAHANTPTPFQWKTHIRMKRSLYLVS